MKKALIFLTIFSFLAACGEEDTTTDSAPDEDGSSKEAMQQRELEAQIAELKADNALKDSVLLETADFIDAVVNNLSKIAYMQGHIRNEGLNVEMQEDPKEWIVQEIEAINKLREDNANQIANLRAKMAQMSAGNAELKAQNDGLNMIIETLNQQILVQEQEIQTLRLQLDELDAEYAEMFDAYLEVTDQVEDLTIAVNTAFYAYGTKKELRDNKVVDKDGGLIGLGGRHKLADDFNKDYFEQIDITITKEITFIGRKPELITSHPSSSYQLEVGDESTILKITNADDFWSASKYLVMIVQ